MIVSSPENDQKHLYQVLRRFPELRESVQSSQQKVSSNPNMVKFRCEDCEYISVKEIKHIIGPNLKYGSRPKSSEAYLQKINSNEIYNHSHKLEILRKSSFNQLEDIPKFKKQLHDQRKQRRELEQNEIINIYPINQNKILQIYQEEYEQHDDSNNEKVIKSLRNKLVNAGFTRIGILGFHSDVKLSGLVNVLGIPPGTSITPSKLSYYLIITLSLKLTKQELNLLHEILFC